MTRINLIRLIVGAIALALAFGAYGVWYGTVTGKSARAVELAGEIQTNGERASRIAAANATLATLGNDESAVGKYFVSSASLVPFLESLQSTGERLGATVTVSSVSSGTRKGRAEISLNGTVSGSFDSVMRFIGSVEYAPYSVTVEQLSVSGGTVSGAASAAVSKWTATFILTVGSQTPVTGTNTSSAVQPAAPTPLVPSGKPTPQS